jgi:hypothetical protein
MASWNQLAATMFEGFLLRFTSSAVKWVGWRQSFLKLAFILKKRFGDIPRLVKSLVCQPAFILETSPPL